MTDFLADPSLSGLGQLTGGHTMSAGPAQDGALMFSSCRVMDLQELLARKRCRFRCGAWVRTRHEADEKGDAEDWSVYRGI